MSFLIGEVFGERDSRDTHIVVDVAYQGLNDWMILGLGQDGCLRVFNHRVVWFKKHDIAYQSFLRELARKNDETPEPIPGTGADEEEIPFK